MFHLQVQWSVRQTSISAVDVAAFVVRIAFIGKNVPIGLQCSVIATT